MSTSETIADPRARFGWVAPLGDDELSQITFSLPGEELEDEGWYVDATSPKRGPVISLEGEVVPKGGVYIVRSKVGEALWARITQAAAGKL